LEDPETRKKLETLISETRVLRDRLAGLGPRSGELARLAREVKGPRRKQSGKMRPALDRLEAGLKDLARQLNDALDSLREFLAEARGLSAPHESRAGRILLVEDDPLTVRLLCHYLKDEKVEVIPVAGAEEALEKMATVEPDLVLLDIILPGMDGFQFLEQLRKQGQAVKAPVIVISSISGEKEMLRAMELGAVDFITKPFAPRIVTAKVMHYLNVG
jgi:CheY-like chemotaxis protein